MRTTVAPIVYRAHISVKVHHGLKIPLDAVGTLNEVKGISIEA